MSWAKLPLKLIPDSASSIKGDIRRWTLIGLAIRLAVMPLFVQSDFLDNYFAAFVLERTGHLIPVAYSYLTLLLLSVWLRILSPLMPNFVYGSVLSTGNIVVGGLQFEVSDPNLYGFLALGKAPFLVFDVLSGILLIWILKNPIQGLKAFKLWMLSPISIFATYVIGQYDVATVFLILLTIVLFQYKRYLLSSLTLGLAVAVEYFPIAILPFLVYLGVRTFQKPAARVRFALLSLASGILPVVISTLLIVKAFPTITGPPFSDFYSASNAITWTIFTHTIGYSVSFATSFVDVIYILPISFVLVFGYVWSRNETSAGLLIEGTSLFFSLFFALGLFLVQWFLWIVPFLIMFVSWRKLPFWLYVVINLAYFVYPWYWGNLITTYLFLPITAQAFQWPTPVQILDSAGIPGLQFVSTIRSILSGALLLFAALIVRDTVKGKLLTRDYAPNRTP
jgi:hypothetical protein